MFQQNIVKVHY